MQNQREVWDVIAEQWFHFRQRPFPDIAKCLEKLVGEWEKGKIIEIGCGNGRNLLIFAKAGFDCYGIDFSKEMLKYAKKFAEKYGFKVKLRQADATSLPFSDESFDYALSIATLHHLKKEEQIKALKEMWRILKKDGEALVSVWNKLSWRWLLKPKENFVAWRVKGKAYERYYYLFWPWELERLLKKAGFKIKSRKWFGQNSCFVVKK